MSKRLIRRIKIAHVTGWMHVGGKENGMVNLVNAMPTEIFENHVYVFRAGGILLQRVDRNKVHVEELGEKLGGDLSIYTKLAKLFRQYRIDIVHTRSWGTLLEGMLAAKFAGVPAIVHGEHGLIKAESKSHVLIQRYLWRWADQVMCVSDVLRGTLEQKLGYPASRIHVIRNGVELDKFEINIDPTDFRNELGLAPDTPIFGSIGRLVPVKNYACLIRAARVVIDKIPNAALIFVGDGPMQADLAQLAEELGITKNVHFLNWRKDVPRIMHSLDTFVLSSWSEGMSNSILEAMCSRKPVVATAVGGNPELVVEGETGLLVPSNDHQKMGEAIRDLLLNHKRRIAMGEAGRKRVEEQFTLPTMIRNYERMYIDVATKRFTFHPELRENINRHFAETHRAASQVKQWSGGVVE